MKGGRNGKNSPEPPGVADNTTDGHSAMVKILQVALIHEKRARKMDLEDERKERKKEMERMEAQHAKELAAWDEERAALDSKLQELYALNREAFTGDDQDAHDRLTRCVLLDFGRDYIRERVYDSPKTTQRKRWDAFTKRFRSMDHFVAETFLLCQQRGSSLSKDALKRIWQPWSNMRRAGNDVAHELYGPGHIDGDICLQVRLSTRCLTASVHHASASQGYCPNRDPQSLAHFAAHARNLSRPAHCVPKSSLPSTSSLSPSSPAILSTSNRRLKVQRRRALRSVAYAYHQWPVCNMWGLPHPALTGPLWGARAAGFPGSTLSFHITLELSEKQEGSTYNCTMQHVSQSTVNEGISIQSKMHWRNASIV
ncbi:hypothetical protein OF83DRAFT_1108088 [Amylostereum chailletii]|nr:hypothetical protein OF83DRAFT_1108088 [Amylostereum chailletii]